MAEAASELGLKPARLYAWIRSGRLPAHHLDPRHLSVRIDDVQRALTTPPPAPARPWAIRPAHPPSRRPTATEVTIWVDDYYRHYSRIPTRDEIWQALTGVTKVRAERIRRDAVRRLLH